MKFIRLATFALLLSTLTACNLFQVKDLEAQIDQLIEQIQVEKPKLLDKALELKLKLDTLEAQYKAIKALLEG